MDQMIGATTDRKAQRGSTIELKCRLQRESKLRE